MNRGGVLNSIFTLLYLFSRNERWERCLMKLLSRTRAWFYFRMALGITFSNSMSQCLTSCYHAEFLQTWWSNTEIREITLAPLHTEEDTSEYLCSASVFPQLSLLKLFFLSFFFSCIFTELTELSLFQIGDRIVSICGTSAEGMSHSQAVNLLKNATGSIQLQVEKTHKHTLTNTHLFSHPLYYN